MSKPTDIRPVAASLYFLPIKTRMPLKFGPEITTEVTCARVKLTVADRQGRTAEGWGETPLSVQWVWPSAESYEARLEALKQFSIAMTGAWAAFEEWGHPIEVGHAFTERVLPIGHGWAKLGIWDFSEDKATLLRMIERSETTALKMPWLAALVCNSPFDLALHDAYGVLHGVPTYETYNSRFMNHDLTRYLERAEGTQVRFSARFPEDYLVGPRPDVIPAWHLVGGKDPLEPSDLTGSEPDDGYPVLLRDWIRRDGLKCLKIKLTGTDAAWDYERLVNVGRIAIEEGCTWLSTDFNCTVGEPEYVNTILDRLMHEHPRIYGMVLYVEQPFPYDLEANRIDVRSVSARKPLFMDESAHDWKLVRLGRELGWSGVALKTCKTQTGALLSLCWAKAHGMTLMVQDLTNPMLAQVPHGLLAAHAGTIMGVETNSMQFYPEASRPEAIAHPGLYRRRGGCIDLSTIGGPGFGYRLDRIARELPEPAAVA